MTTEQLEKKGFKKRATTMGFCYRLKVAPKVYVHASYLKTGQVHTLQFYDKSRDEYSPGINMI
jgi:hypothetical protein